MKNDYSLTKVDVQLMSTFKDYLLFTYKIENKLLYLKHLLNENELSVNITDKDIVNILKTGVSLTIKNIDLICNLFDSSEKNIKIPEETVFYVKKLMKYIIQVYNNSGIDVKSNSIIDDTNYCLIIPISDNSDFEEIVIELAMENKDFHAFFTPEIKV